MSFLEQRQVEQRLHRILFFFALQVEAQTRFKFFVRLVVRIANQEQFRSLVVMNMLQALLCVSDEDWIQNFDVKHGLEEGVLVQEVLEVELVQAVEVAHVS